MKLTLETFQRLQRRVETLQRDYDRSEGALTQVLERLQTEHDCQNIAQAERKLAKLEKELEKEEKAFTAELEAFEQELEEHD